MMNKFKVSQVDQLNQILRKTTLLSIPMLCLLLVATPAFAHHPMGGKTPSDFFQGFLSGLAHPVIGFDHLVFVISIGLLAVTKKQGIVIPIVFALAAMLGTVLHLVSFSLPAVELFVSGSVLLFGILIIMKNNPNTMTIALIGAIAGLFHGYAYGEAIFGAETTPLLAYLAGFTIVQLVISLSAFWIGKTISAKRENEPQSSSKLRSAGLVICGVGLTLLANQIIGLIFPVANG
jgi:urease accessory protein